MSAVGELAPTRVHELIALVVEKAGSIGRTRLTKLLYLVDEAHFARFGVTLTGGTWVRYTYGPMLVDLPRVSADLSGHEVTVSEYVDDAGYRHADYASQDRSSWRFQPQLRDHEVALIGEIFARYGGLSRDEVVRVAYETPPMRLMLKWEAGAERLDNVAIPFHKALGQPGEGLMRYRRIADAVQGRSAGTPEERIELERETLFGTRALRGLATDQLLGDMESG